jgi:arginase
VAVKIVRQPKKITLVGSSTSAAGLRGGQERAPAALRSAGLADRLKTAGFTVADLGDTSVQLNQPDNEHPRARNVQPILKSLNDLRPMVEVAVKSGALPLILSGDSISVLATIAGIRRYFRDVTLVYMDRDAALNFPATSASGFIDGMVLSHVIGRGAPELVRFWGEPPLVRESDIVLFGFERVDPPEQQYLSTSLFRSYPAQTIASQGSAASARKVLDRIEDSKHQFILHVDLDVIDSELFQPVNFPGRGGLNLSQVREALKVFAGHPNLLAIDVAGYNPELDADGEGARLIVDLLADVLGARLEPPVEVGSPAAGSTEAAGSAAEPAPPGTSAASEAAQESKSPAPIEPDSPGPAGSDSIPI